MTDDDRIKWDAKYREKLRDSDPSRILTRYWHLASPGNALDIACGGGRNSLFLAEQGFFVDAVDISTVATNHLAGIHPNIHVICQDLDTWKMPKIRYDLIVNIRFLDRGLFPMIQDGLKIGGLLIFESFLNGESDDYCLKPNELLHAFPLCRIVYYEEKKTEHGDRFDYVAALVAIKPAP